MSMEVLLGNIEDKLKEIREKLGITNVDSSCERVLITGGTGVVGYRVTTRLLLAGHPVVRFGSHCHLEHTLHKDNVKLVEELNKMGGEVADFNWSDESTYANALDGVTTVFCTAPYIMDWKERFPAFLEACQQAGVRHFIKLSFYHARRSGDAFQDVPLVRAHGDLDEMLAESGMSYTILSATHFMSNPFYFQNRELRKKQKPAIFYGASGGKGVNYVSPNDIAEFAVRVMLNPRPHRNKEYTLTGPEAIKDEVISTLLSRHLKKSIKFVDQPLHTFEDGEKRSGDPEWMVLDLVALERIKRSGREQIDDFVTNDIEMICGHKAQTYEDYLKATDTMTPLEAT